MLEPERLQNKVGDGVQRSQQLQRKDRFAVLVQSDETEHRRDGHDGKSSGKTVGQRIERIGERQRQFDKREGCANHCRIQGGDEIGRFQLPIHPRDVLVAA